MENQDISMSVQQVEMAFQGMAHILSKVFDLKELRPYFLKAKNLKFVHEMWFK